MVQLKYSIINDESAEKGIAPHFHASYELTYYISGKGYCEYQEKRTALPTSADARETYLPYFEEGAEKKRLYFGTGSCILFPPNTVHSKRHTEDSRFLSLVFDVTDETLRPTKIYCSVVESGPISHLLNRAINEYKTKQANYVKMLNCLLSELCIELCRSGQNPMENGIDDFISQSVQYVDDYYLSEIDFKHFCESNGYSLDYFRHKFKTQTGYPPKAYLLKKRIDHAVLLLTSTNLSVNRIAELCQFGDYSQFSTYFSKRFGLSPMQYRKKNK